MQPLPPLVKDFISPLEKCNNAQHEISIILNPPLPSSPPFAGRSPAADERRTKYGCENTTLQIDCEEGTVINIVRANFGRFSIAICNPHGHTDWSVNCFAPDTTHILKKR